MNAWDLSCRSASATTQPTTQLATLASPLPSSASYLSTSSSASSSSSSGSSFTSSLASTSASSNCSLILPNDQQHLPLSLQHPQSQKLQQLDQRKARKKDQNRKAAYNYRRKKMEERNKMLEEEMRLVYSRVCLVGYAEELESSIMYILNTKTRRILDKDGNISCFLCPICLQTCDNILNLRSHLNSLH